jgi:hypothetical protein
MTDLEDPNFTAPRLIVQPLDRSQPGFPLAGFSFPRKRSVHVQEMMRIQRVSTCVDRDVMRFEFVYKGLVDKKNHMNTSKVSMQITSVATTIRDD